MGLMAAVWAASILTSCAPTLPVLASSEIVEGGVRVSIDVRGQRGAEAELRVRFVPLDDGFHVYSLTHDPLEARGVGVPTSVRPMSGVDLNGPWRTDAALERIHYLAIDLELQVFEDGPVVLTAPVRRHEGEPVVLALSYAACSTSICLPPVLDRQVVLRDIASP